MIDIYLRPLSESDAMISFDWRNDPLVWVHTKFVRKQPITYEIERKWLKDTLNDKNHCRFAICITSTDQYIGNTQLLNIAADSAEFHLFIGTKEFWGKGIGQQASMLILNHGFKVLHLKKIFLEVHAENKSAFSIYNKLGFQKISSDVDFVKMVLHADHWLSLTYLLPCTL